MLCSADDACVFCERIMSSPFNDWSSSWWYSTTEIIVRNDTCSSSRYTAVVWYPSMHRQSNLVAGLRHMVWFWIHGGIINKLHGWIYPTIISVEDYRRSGRLGHLESAGYGKSVFIRYMSWIWELRWQKLSIVRNMCWKKKKGSVIWPLKCLKALLFVGGVAAFCSEGIPPLTWSLYLFFGIWQQLFSFLLQFHFLINQLSFAILFSHRSVLYSLQVEKFLPNGFNNRCTLHPWKFQKPSICSFLLL